MNKFKYILFLISALLISVNVCAAETEISGSTVASLNVIDGYSVCTADGCDDSFNALLAANKMTFSDWKAKVMDPESYVLYACDENNNTECLSVKDAADPSKIDNSNAENHKYSKDYAIVENGDPKDKLLDDIKKALISNSVSSNSITDIKWINNSAEYPTPYIMYTYSSSDGFVTCYQTVYCGKKINLQFTSQVPFTTEKLAEFGGIVSQIKYNETPDYTEVKNLIEKSAQDKLEKETNINKNSKTTVYLFAGLIFIIIVFAIYMAIRSQKKRKNKR